MTSYDFHHDKNYRLGLIERLRREDLVRRQAGLPLRMTPWTKKVRNGWDYTDHRPWSSLRCSEAALAAGIARDEARNKRLGFLRSP